MTIEALVKIVPPPAAPDEAFSGPWKPIETLLGTGLPQDYKDFVRLYGAGNYMDFLGINVPRTRSPYVRLETEAYAVAQLFRTMQANTYEPWPEIDDLLSFGRTDDGDYLFWRRAGPPDEWKVVVWSRGFDTFETFDCGLADFLVGLATGGIDSDLFPRGRCDHMFRPYSDWPSRAFSLSWRVRYGASD